jgi:tRNA(fMet)-specific endonuclease VapC
MSSIPPPAGTGTGGAYLLDSSVLIRSLRGDAAITARIDAALQVYVSSIVLGELYLGAYGSPTRTDAAIADVETVERTIAVLVLDAATARIYAQLKNDLKHRNLTMPDNDLWIAATAIQYDVTLAARDAHFTWIAGLRVEQW